MNATAWIARSKRAAVAAWLATVAVHPSAAPEALRSEPEIVRLALQDGSRLWLEGDSNLRKWSCEARGFVPEVRLERPGPSDPPSRIESASLLVPVDRIECGIGKMNENLRSALHADRFPEIVFDLTEAEVVDSGVRGSVGVIAHGLVRVAGNARPITLQISGTDTGKGSLRLRGRASLQMTNYGIKPPTALLGLLRTKDEVTILFDLVADYEQLERSLS